MTRFVDLFVVRSPFQVVNALEAIASYRSTDARMCVIGSTPDELAQVDGIIGRSELDDVELVDDASAFGLRRDEKLDRIFLGDYREPEQRRLARRLGAGRPVLLDDGNATLMIARRRQQVAWRLTDRRTMSLSAQSHGRRVPVPTILRDLTDPGSREYGAVEFFSIYRVKGARRDTYRPNTLEQLRGGVEPPRSVRPVFIGSSLVETGIMKPDSYRARVRHAVEGSDGTLLYIAHRKELDRNLERLRDELGIEILRPEVPIEMVLLEQGIRPSRIWAVLSSAFDTLRMIFPDVPAQTDPPVGDDVFAAYQGPVETMVALTRATSLACDDR